MYSQLDDGASGRCYPYRAGRAALAALIGLYLMHTIDLTLPPWRQSLKQLDILFSLLHCPLTAYRRCLDSGAGGSVCLGCHMSARPVIRDEIGSHYTFFFLTVCHRRLSYNIRGPQPDHWRLYFTNPSHCSNEAAHQLRRLFHIRGANDPPLWPQHPSRYTPLLPMYLPLHRDTKVTTA